MKYVLIPNHEFKDAPVSVYVPREFQKNVVRLELCVIATGQAGVLRCCVLFICPSEHFSKWSSFRLEHLLTKLYHAIITTSVYNLQKI
jgi:hypothetical protein